MSSYKLYYFNARAGGEPIRIIFAQAGVKYEDVRFEREEWAKKYKQGILIVFLIASILSMVVCIWKK